MHEVVWPLLLWRDLNRGWIYTYSGCIKGIQASVKGDGGCDDHIKANYNNLDFYEHYQDILN